MWQGSRLWQHIAKSAILFSTTGIISFGFPSIVGDLTLRIREMIAQVADELKLMVFYRVIMSISWRKFLRIFPWVILWTLPKEEPNPVLVKEFQLYQSEENHCNFSISRRNWESVCISIDRGREKPSNNVFIKSSVPGESFSMIVVYFYNLWINSRPSIYVRLYTQTQTFYVVAGSDLFL